MFETPIFFSSVTAQGSHILLGFDYAQSFETPRINNHSVNEPSTLIVLGGESVQSFETPPKNNHGVTASSDHILLVSD